MRESVAKGAAVGTGVLVVAAVGVFGLLQQPGQAEPDPSRSTGLEERPATPVADTLVELGIRVYEEQRCAVCHSIAGVGSPRSPLDGVGSRLTTEEIRLWIVDPQEMRPGIRKPAYDDLPDDELEALVAYMESLRAPGG